MSSLVISINSQRAPLSTYTFKLTRSYAVEQPEGEVGQWVRHANRVSARLSEPWYQNVQKWNRTRHYFRWRCWRARANLQTASELKVLILNRACILALRRSRPRDGKVRSIRRECVRRLCGLRTYVTCRARRRMARIIHFEDHITQVTVFAEIPEDRDCHASACDFGSD
jgi:hypothetical protein